MKLLEDRIREQGQVRPGNVLKVDCFLNHQLDVDLLDAIGGEFHRLFAGQGINKILTIEASGIAIACMAARTSTARCIPPPFTPTPTGGIMTSRWPKSSWGRRTGC